MWARICVYDVVMHACVYKRERVYSTANDMCQWSAWQWNALSDYRFAGLSIFLSISIFVIKERITSQILTAHFELRKKQKIDKGHILQIEVISNRLNRLNLKTSKYSWHYQKGWSIQFKLKRPQLISNGTAFTILRISAPISFSIKEKIYINKEKPLLK